MKGGALAVVMVATGVAAAEPARVAQVSSTGVCELASLEARAGELLGRAAIDPAASAQITVVTAQSGDAVTATLTFTDENGTPQPPREMTAASCDELGESVAIVISLVLRQAAPPPPAAPAPPPRVIEPVAPPVQVEATYVPPPPSRTKSVEAALAMSSAKQAALVLGGRLDFTRTALVVDLELAMPSTVQAAQGQVHITAARADAGGCLRMHSFGACGLVSGGFVRARGEDLMDARTAIRPVISVGIRSEWRQRVAGRLGLRVFAGVDQVVVRPSILVGDVDVWTPPLIQVWLGGGIFFEMP